MKKLFFVLLFIPLSFFSLVASQPVSAAPACTNTNDICGNAGQGQLSPCCNSNDKCERDPSKPNDCSARNCDFRCVQQKPGTTCLDEGATGCVGSATVSGCCTTSQNGPNKGKPLTCDNNNKCVIDTGCSKDGQPCGGLQKSCCGGADASGNQLLCLNSNGNPVNNQTSEEGTCKSTRLQTNSDPNAPPLPPSPPCNSFDATFGGCRTVPSAFGDFATDPSSFISRVFGLMIGLAGGIALLLIILAGYKFMTSQGKPEAIQQARDQLIAAIVGLLFLIFSFVILEVIGVDILRIPNIGNPPAGIPAPQPNPSTPQCDAVSGTCIRPGQGCAPPNVNHGSLDCGGGFVCCQ